MEAGLTIPVSDPAAAGLAVAAVEEDHAVTSVQDLVEGGIAVQDHSYQALGNCGRWLT